MHTAHCVTSRIKILTNSTQKQSIPTYLTFRDGVRLGGPRLPLLLFSLRAGNTAPTIACLGGRGVANPASPLLLLMVVGGAIGGAATLANAAATDAAHTILGVTALAERAVVVASSSSSACVKAKM